MEYLHLKAAIELEMEGTDIGADSWPVEPSQNLREKVPDLQGFYAVLCYERHWRGAERLFDTTDIFHQSVGRNSVYFVAQAKESPGKAVIWQNRQDDPTTAPFNLDRLLDIAGYKVEKRMGPSH